jgi:hypothetical protein
MNNEGPMNRPSLFAFATSELSQDAFLCWLLSWAHPQFGAADPALHDTAVTLLKRLLTLPQGEWGIELPAECKAIEIKRQFKHIDVRVDVLVLINDDIALIIEDKTYTKEHSDQLRRYREAVQKAYPERKKIAAVYLKTGDESSWRAAKAAGYGCFQRRDFIKLLDDGEPKGITNDIYRDFHEHLRRIDDAVSSFRRVPIGRWVDRSAWTGFFVALQEQLGVGDWDYVPFPGDFMGFWWGWRGNKYLQLEESQLCFKIHVPEQADRAQAWQAWHDALMSQARMNGLLLRKPGRRGSGKYMTVAVLDGEYRQADDLGILDFEKTMSRLRECQRVLNLAVEASLAGGSEVLGSPPTPAIGSADALLAAMEAEPHPTAEDVAELEKAIAEGQRPPSCVEVFPEEPAGAETY